MAPPKGTELMERRTQNTKTFAGDGPGRFLTRVHDGPVHFKDAAGAWQDIKTELVDAGAGKVRNEANTFTAEVNLTPTVAGAAGSFVNFKLDDGHAIGYTLANALPTAGLGVVDPANKNVATFSAVWPATDIKLTSQPGGLKEDLILHSAIAPDAYVFPLHLVGLTAELDAHGDVVYRDAQGTERARTPRGWMEDSNIDPGRGEGVHSEGVHYELVTLPGNVKALKVVLDRAWLNDPARVYPVRVDPFFQQNTQSDDTYVQQPYNNNYSGDYQLKVGTFNGGGDKARSFLHFYGLDIAGLNGKNIDSATMWLYTWHSYSCNARPVRIHRIVDNWNADTYRTFPGANFGEMIDEQNFAKGYSSACPANWHGFNAQSAVHNWTHGVWPNQGVMVVSPNENDSYGWKKFYAWNQGGDAAGQPTPHLDINWSEPNSPPNTPDTLSPAANARFTNRTPTLSARGTDPNGNNVAMRFRLWRDNASGAYIGGKNGGYICNGCSDSWTAPTLSDGTYYWESWAYDGQYDSPHTARYFTVDTTGPGAPPNPTSSSHPTTTNWYSTRSFSGAWDAPADGAGIGGYNVSVDQNSSTLPAASNTQTSRTFSTTVNGDGQWYMHVRSVDSLGNWSTTAAHYGFRVDTTSPTTPGNVRSTSGHLANVPSSNRNVAMAWDAASDAHSGVSRYAYAFNQSQNTAADPAGTTTTGLTANSAALSDGSWYFHVRTVDNAKSNSSGGTSPCDVPGPDAGAYRCASTPYTWLDTTGGTTVALTDDSVSTGIAMPFALTWYGQTKPTVYIGSNGLLCFSSMSCSSYNQPAPPNAAAPNDLLACFWEDLNPGTGGTVRYKTVGDTFVVEFNGVPHYGSTTALNTFQLHLRSNGDARCMFNSTSSDADSVATGIGIENSDGTQGVRYRYGEVALSSTGILFSRNLGFDGNVSGDVVYGPIVIDATGPNAPGITSLTHPEDQWKRERNATFTWTPPTDASVITGYRVKFNEVEQYDPTAQDGFTATPAWTESDIFDGIHWLHVAAVDAAGNQGATDHYKVMVDGTPSDAPVISSNTHPDESIFYEEDDPAFTWTVPADTSGVVGYSYELDQLEGTEPNESVDTTNAAVSYTDLEDGVHWLHVRAVDRAGNVSATDHYQVSIHFMTNADNGAGGDNVGPGEIVNTPEIPVLPDVVAPPAGGLPDLFPNDGLLGNDPIFGGGILPDDDPADAVGDAFGAVRPALPPTPDLGKLATEGLETIRSLPRLPFVFDIIEVATYQVRTTRHNPDGTSSSRDDVFLACLPTSYSSSTGAPSIDPDLRINLCPRPESITTGVQTLDYDLDALKPGVRVTVTVTYRPAGKQLLITTEARDRDHPTDFRATMAGVEGPNYQDYAVTTTTSHSVGLMALDLSTLVGTEYEHEGHIRIDELPADGVHRYSIFGREADEIDRSMEAEITLDGNAAGAGETLTVEQFDPTQDGKLTARARFANVPKDFTTMTFVELGPGPVDSAKPVSLNLWGGGDAAPTMSIGVEQFDGSRRLGLLNLADMARHYDYRIEVLEEDGVEKGAYFKAFFNQGTPADGRIQLARYRVEGDTDVIDGILDISRFASTTEFTGRLDGDPRTADGQSATLDLNNANPVTGQLVQVVQRPVDREPMRLVLAGDGHPASRVQAPVAGRNLRWDAMPQTLNAAFRFQEREDGTPVWVTFDGTSSAAPVNGRLEVTDTVAEGTAGLVIGAITSNHFLQIDFEGSLTNVRKAVVQRDNKSSRPEQYLQFFLEDDNGIRTQARFMGPAASSAGLKPGAGRDIDGVVSNVPDNFSFGVALDQPTATVTRAQISGHNGGVFASNMDVRLKDNRRGFELHQSSLPPEYNYPVSAEFVTPGGDIKKASIAGWQSANNPNGLLELSYGGLKTVFRSLTPEFSYTADIEGPIENPLRLNLTQRQSIDNPGSLVQIAKYDGASATPRAAYTLRNSGTVVLPERGSLIDAVWTGVPKDLDVKVGRVPGKDRESITVDINTWGVDLPNSDVVLRRGVAGGATQEVRVHGVAPRFVASADIVGSPTDPDVIHLDLIATVRHASDSVVLRNYDAAGVLTHSVKFLGGFGLSDNARDVAAVYEKVPESIVLDYVRKRENGRDKSYKVDLFNYVVNGDGSRTQTAPAGDARFVIDIRKLSATSEYLHLVKDIAGEVHMFYERPAATVPEEGNCIGNVTYSSSSSAVNMDFKLFLQSSCLTGPIEAQIVDMPSAGFQTALLQPDGDAVFSTKVVNGQRQQVGRISMVTPPPVGEERFLNKRVQLTEQLCMDEVAPGSEHYACLQPDIDADPEYRDVRVTVVASGLESIDLRTNYTGTGAPKPFPGGDKIDEEVWENLPIMGIQYRGGGEMSVNVTGNDDSTVENYMNQHVDCCLKFSPQKARFTNNADIDGMPLRVRFYGWVTDSEDHKYNRKGERLNKGFGSYIHFHGPGASLEPTPFNPRFIAGPADKNSINVLPGETAYFVPNPYDMLLSDPVANPVTDPNRSRWYARHKFTHLWQTDWFFQILLHEIAGDPHGFTP